MPATGFGQIDVPSIADLCCRGRCAGDRDAANCQSMADDDQTQTYLSQRGLLRWRFGPAKRCPVIVLRRTRVWTYLQRHGLLYTQAIGRNLGQRPRPPDQTHFLTSVALADGLGSTWMPFSDTAESGHQPPCSRPFGRSLRNEPRLDRPPGRRHARSRYGRRTRRASRLSVGMPFRRDESPCFDLSLSRMLCGLRHAICGTQSFQTASASRRARGIPEVLLSTGPRAQSYLGFWPLRDNSHGSTCSKLYGNRRALNAFRLILALPPDTDISADDNVDSVAAQPGSVNILTVIITPNAPGVGARLRINASCPGITALWLRILPLYSEPRM